MVRFLKISHDNCDGRFSLRMMTSFVFNTIGFFFLNFVSFLCKGQINLPPEGATFCALNRSDVEIKWTFSNIPPNPATVLKWTFVPTGETLATIVQQDVDIPPSSLPRVNATNPATLVLRNVDHRYNGTYRFEISTRREDPDPSEVTLFVAVKPNVTISCSTSTTVNKTDDVRCLCKGEGGNPPANVAWYKNDVQIDTKDEENLLILSNVDGTDSGTYKCVAESCTLNDTKSINVTVNFAPEVTSFAYSPTTAVIGQSVTITCEASGHPEPTYTIIHKFHNDTYTLSTEKTYTVVIVNACHAGSYECIAGNKLGKSSKNLSLVIVATVGPVQTTTATSTTTEALPTSNACFSNKVRECGSVVVWQVVVALLSGIVIGVLLSCIVVRVYFRRQFGNKRPAQSNPEPQTSNKVDSIYQDLDLSKMNQEENYQTLRAVNSGESDYTELNLESARDVEENYQSLS